jgi:7-cyano-7-deazaguanine reductase
MTTLTHLGKTSPIENDPAKVVLDRIPNPHQAAYYAARFTIPEFTSLCPVTGQPDFATLIIDYFPNKWLVESKALKLYMYSFRDHGAFHEDCTLTIGRRLNDELQPHWFRIVGLWQPRGGIPIDIFWTTGELPHNCEAPEIDYRPYRYR